MRIFVGGINHETNSFNPLPTTIESFEIRRGLKLLDDPGVKPFADEGIDVAASLWAEAIPSGPVEKLTYSYFKESILYELGRCGPIDGVCLFLHGAMVVDEIGDGENDLVKSVRQAVGPDVLISASLDLHGNIDPELARHANILTGYRTAPHIDRERTRYRAFSSLVDCIRKCAKPEPVIIKIPVMIPGDPAITDEEPAAGLYARLSDIDRIPGIVSASLMIGYSWSDIAGIGSSVIVVAEGPEYREAARAEASALAMDFWALRAGFHYTVPSGTVDEAIRMAAETDDGPVFISDSGDNVTSGAAGDVPLIAERLVSSGVDGALVAGIIDPEAVGECRRAGVNAEVHLELGGKLDMVNGTPFSLDARVKRLYEDGAVVTRDGVDIIVVARRIAFTEMGTFRAYGADPERYSIVAVKLGYLFPELKAIAKHSIVAFSPGFASQKLDLPYKHIPRPIFPLDTDFEWAP